MILWTCKSLKAEIFVSYFQRNRSNNDSRDYILQTTFPNKEYRDRSINLKDAGLLNAVLIQKYI